MNVTVNNTLIGLSQNISASSASDIQNPIYQFAMDFAAHYRPLHHMLAAGVCIFGVCANAINVCVLSRPHMRTPTNIFLVAIAVCDIALMCSYLSVSLMNPSSDRAGVCRQTYTSAVWLISHANLSVTLYGISTWLTVVLGGMRCAILLTKGRYDRPDVVVKLVILVIIFVIMSCIPNYVCQGVVYPPQVKRYCSDRLNITRDSDIPVIGPSAFSLQHHNAPLRVAYWMSGVVFKIVPCCLLTIFMILLIHILFKSQRNRRRLLGCKARSVQGPRPSLAEPSPGASPSVMSVRLRLFKLRATNGYIKTGSPSMLKVQSQPVLINHRLAVEQNCDMSPKSLGSAQISCALSVQKGSTETVTTGATTLTNKLTLPRRNGSAMVHECNFATRITLVLVGILFIFLITQVPQGLCLILSGVLDHSFRRYFNNSFSEFSELLSLINCSVNFVLYCSMSSQFREAAAGEAKRLWDFLRDQTNSCCYFSSKLICSICRPPKDVSREPDFPAEAASMLDEMSHKLNNKNNSNSNSSSKNNKKWARKRAERKASKGLTSCNSCGERHIPQVSPSSASSCSPTDEHQLSFQSLYLARSLSQQGKTKHINYCRSSIGSALNQHSTHL